MSNGSITCGIGEKLIAAFKEADRPLTITFLLTYPEASAPPQEALQARLDSLCDRYPILSYRVTGLDSSKVPQLIPGGKRPHVTTLQYSAGEKDDTIISASVKRGDQSDWETGPLLNVEIIRPGNAQPGQKIFVAVTVTHLISDGIGVRNLVKLLLDDAEAVDEPLPRIMEDLLPSVIPTKPSPPSAPSPSKPCWPGSIPSPLDMKSLILYFSYPFSLLSDLKLVGEGHGVRLECILAISWLISMWDYNNRSDQKIAATTLIDVRSEIPGSPLWALNYYFPYGHTFTPSPTTDFWSSAKEHNMLLHDEEGRKAAQTKAGNAAHLPWPWKDMFIAKARSETPYSASVGLSNLGWMDLPKGAEDLSWTTSASPFLVPLFNHWIGHQGGLRLTVSMPDGAGMTREQALRTERTFEKVLRSVASGRTGTWAEMLDTRAT